MKFGYFACAQFMHQHKCSVNKISKNGDQFTVISLLEIFPGKIIILCFGSVGTKNITKHIFTTGKIFKVLMHPHGPVTAGRNFITLNIQKFVGRDIIRQHKSSMCLQHRRENDAMENDIVFANKMDQPRVFLAPVIGPSVCQLLCSTYVTDRRIKPYIQYFSTSSFRGGGAWNLYTPIAVPGHGAALQTIIQPTF